LTNTFTYTAFAGFSGTDSFQYIVTDDAGAASMPATVRIDVERPSVVDASLAVQASSVVIDIRSLASHPEGGAALANFAGTNPPPQHGTLTIGTVNWTITYTPDAGYKGSDSFNFTVTDIYGVTSNVGTVNLSITKAITAQDAGKASKASKK